MNRPVRFGLFELDLATGELNKQGRKIKLQDQPLQVLELLLSRAGEVITREELQQALWPADTFVEFDQGLNTAIKKIRLALGDSADNPRFVETIPRKGYRFIAPVELGPQKASAVLQKRHPADAAAFEQTDLAWGRCRSRLNRCDRSRRVDACQIRENTGSGPGPGSPHQLPGQ